MPLCVAPRTRRGHGAKRRSCVTLSRSAVVVVVSCIAGESLTASRLGSKPCRTKDQSDCRQRQQQTQTPASSSWSSSTGHRSPTTSHKTSLQQCTTGCREAAPRTDVIARAAPSQRKGRRGVSQHVGDPAGHVSTAPRSPPCPTAVMPYGRRPPPSRSIDSTKALHTVHPQSSGRRQRRRDTSHPLVNKLKLHDSFSFDRKVGVKRGALRSDHFEADRRTFTSTVRRQLGLFQSKLNRLCCN